MRIWGFMKRYPGIALILSTFGLVFVLFDTFSLAGMLRGAHQLQATVVDSKTAYSRTRRGGTRVSGYYPIVTYTHPNGQRQQQTATTKISSKPAPGSTITIYAHRTDPRRAILVKDFWALWGNKIIGGGIASVLFGFSLLFYLRRSAGAKPPKPVPAAAPVAFAPAAFARDPFQDGIARYQAGDLRGALQDLSAVISQAPSGMAYEWRGDTHASLGDRPAAARDYQAAAHMYQRENHGDHLRRAMGKAAQAAA